MSRTGLIALAWVSLLGCQEPNPGYCAMNPGVGDCPDPSACDTKSDCAGQPQAPACDQALGKCVQCAPDDQAFCGGDQPRCASNQCVACVDDNDCGGAAGVCLPSGACAKPDAIIHAISTGGSNQMTCGGMGAGVACTLETALGLATPMRNIVKLDDAGPYRSGNPFVANKDVVLAMRGATLEHMGGSDNPVFIVASNINATLIAGTVRGGKGGNGHGIQCDNDAKLTVEGTTIETNDRSGINAPRGTITVTGATIRNNGNRGINITDGALVVSRTRFETNRGGGLNLNDASFTIVGNVFLNNGDAGSPTGGITINTAAKNNRLEFNTIADNIAQATAGAGVTCSADSDFIAQNNILRSNNSYVANNLGIQAVGTCRHAFSSIGPLAIAQPIDAGNNQNVDPVLKDTKADPHLTPTSPLLMLRANPQADLTGIAAKDIDGQPRVAPATIGADQP